MFLAGLPCGWTEPKPGSVDAETFHKMFPHAMSKAPFCVVSTGRVVSKIWESEIVSSTWSGGQEPNGVAVLGGRWTRLSFE